MNSRERLIAAIEHRQPDKIPVDFGGHRSSGIMAIAYKNLRNYLGLEKRLPKVYDVIQQLAIIEDDVYERFPTDVADMSRAFCLDGDTGWKEWVLPDGSPCLIPEYVDVRKRDGHWFIYNDAGRECGVMREGALYFDQTYWPYFDGIPEDLSGFEEMFTGMMWGAVPTPPKGMTPEAMATRVAEYRRTHDTAINFPIGANLYENASYLCSLENTLMWMLLEPELFEALLDRLLERHLRQIETVFKAVAPHLDSVMFGDDFGMGTGPQFSLDLYLQYFQPRERIMWKRVKEIAPHIKINFHSCGGIYPFIQPLADAGLEALNPVQTNCAGMDPQVLKETLGKIMCFWGGGCDTNKILPRGTPTEVREHVKERCRIFSPGGGFVFTQIHNIMADVPPQNIAAMLDAVHEFNGALSKEMV